MSSPLQLPLVSLPSPEASLAVNNCRPSRKLFCHVDPMHEQYAVAVASEGIAEQMFFTMGGHDRPQARVIS